MLKGYFVNIIPFYFIFAISLLFFCYSVLFCYVFATFAIFPIFCV